jgi:hypothetical protein
MEPPCYRDYEAAMHYDCYNCTAECAFRKERTSFRIAAICYILFIIALAVALIA